MKVKNLYRKLVSHKWTIGLVENDLGSILSGEPLKMHWIESTFKDRWFADPFILDVTDSEIFLLVEEFYYPINRGRIAKLTIDRKTYQVRKSDLLLQLDTHLSFPAIFREGADVYIYPENSESGSSFLYKYDKKNNSCEKINVLANEPFTDAIVTDLFGEKLLFSTKEPMPNKNLLGIYSYDSKIDQFVFRENMIFDENIARNGGGYFLYNGEYYRPAQESNSSYGHALIIQKILRDNDKKWMFKEIRRLYSSNKRFDIGLHTFNNYKGVTVIDVKGFENYHLGHLLSKIRRLL